MYHCVWIFVPLVLSCIAIYLRGCCCSDKEKTPYVFEDPEKRRAFERWHDHQIEQLGIASNTLFILASAALGYSLTLLGSSNQTLVLNHPICIRVFTYAFVLSFILGLLFIFNRLRDFGKTMRRHKLRDEKPEDSEIGLLYKATRRMGAWTWQLFCWQIFYFAVGSMAIIWFWVITYSAEI